MISPRPEIILFGDDAGTSEICSEYSLRHVPNVRRGMQGTPYLNDIFLKTADLAEYKVLCYLNSDIIIFPDMLAAVQLAGVDNCLIAGRRWDIEIDGLLDFSNGWAERFLCEIAGRATLHGYSGIDYLVFDKSLSHGMPDFYIGRPGWDNWFLWRARQLGCRIVDATSDVKVVHQNHDYSHSKFGEAARVSGPEFIHNISLTNGCREMLTLRDADVVLEKGELKSPPVLRHILGKLAALWLGRELMAMRRRRLCKH